MAIQFTSNASSTRPIVRAITPADVKDALARGLDDFWAMPTHVIFLSMIYPVLGLILARIALGYGLLPLLFPLTAGLALVGTFAALGLCELSRRREQNLDTEWWRAFQVTKSPSFGRVMVLAIVLTVIFLIWLEAAQGLYVANLGTLNASSIPQFVRDLLTTDAGWRLIIEGNAVGLVFAALALTISFVSFPLLLDHNVAVTVAVLTSIRVVFRNPLPAATWGAIIAAALVVGSLPFFIGLAIAMPVLGHTSWHVFRRAVGH